MEVVLLKVLSEELDDMVIDIFAVVCDRNAMILFEDI